MKQHVCVEAALERKASATLRAVEGLLCVCPVDGLVGFELQQLAEGFPAVFAAQRLLVLTRTLLLRSASMGLGLYNTFRSSGVSWVTVVWIFWLQLTRTFKKLFINLLHPLILFLLLAAGHGGLVLMPAFTGQTVWWTTPLAGVVNANWPSLPLSLTHGAIEDTILNNEKSDHECVLNSSHDKGKHKPEKHKTLHAAFPTKSG